MFYVGAKYYSKYVPISDLMDCGKPVDVLEIIQYSRKIKILTYSVWFPVPMCLILPSNKY